jgi:hypothetical protein
VVGAFLLGAGMTVAGSCPGTVFSQIGAGSHKAAYIIVGGVAGALLFGFLEGASSRSRRDRPRPPYRRTPRACTGLIPRAQERMGSFRLPASVQTASTVVRLSPNATAVLCAAAMLAAVIFLEIWFPWRDELRVSAGVLCRPLSSANVRPPRART